VAEEGKELKTEQQMFDLELIDIAVSEHHKYCIAFNRAKTEKDAKMFYTAVKIGAIQGINYAVEHMKKQDQQANKEKKNGNN
jgi:hypothetical protein